MRFSYIYREISLRGKEEKEKKTSTEKLRLQKSDLIHNEHVVYAISRCNPSRFESLDLLFDCNKVVIDNRHSSRAER